MAICEPYALRSRREFRRADNINDLRRQMLLCVKRKYLIRRFRNGHTDFNCINIIELFLYIRIGCSSGMAVLPTAFFDCFV